MTAAGWGGLLALPAMDVRKPGDDLGKRSRGGKRQDLTPFTPTRKLLIRRFGPLPAWAEGKLTGAEPARLEAWAERLLEAATLEAVFVEE